jgi:hypothetical protein
MAVEKPEVGGDIKLGNNLPFTAGATLISDLYDAIHHQHIRQRQLGVAWAKHLTTTTLKQLLFAK